MTGITCRNTCLKLRRGYQTDQLATVHDNDHSLSRVVLGCILGTHLLLAITHVVALDWKTLLHCVRQTNNQQNQTQITSNAR